MKKVLIGFVAVSSIILSFTGCNSPTNNTADPSASPSPTATGNPAVGNPTGGNGASKAAVIAVYNCVKVKSPELAGAMEAYIASVNAATEVNWARDSAEIVKSLSRFEAYGCKI